MALTNERLVERIMDMLKLYMRPDLTVVEYDRLYQTLLSILRRDV